MKVIMKTDKIELSKTTGNKYIYFENEFGDPTKLYTYKQAYEHVLFCRALGLEIIYDTDITF